MKEYMVRIERGILVVGVGFTLFDCEEYESIQEAETRAKVLREMGAKVELYRLL